MNEPSGKPAVDRRGIAGCAIALVIGVLAIASSGEFSALGSVFPRTIAGLMIVLAVLYVVLAFRQRGAVTGSDPTLTEPAASTPRRIGVAVVILAWSFLLAPLGFLFTSICACLALLGIAQHDRWTPRTGLLYGAATAVVLLGLYALFRFALKVPLPVGVFW